MLGCTQVQTVGIHSDGAITVRLGASWMECQGMMPRGTRLVVKLGLERHMWSYLGYVLCMGAGPEPSARPLREEEELGRALVVSRNNLCVDCCGAPKSTCPERELRDAVRRRPPSLKVREGTLAGSEGGARKMRDTKSPTLTCKPNDAEQAPPSVPQGRESRASDQSRCGTPGTVGERASQS